MKKQIIKTVILIVTFITTASLVAIILAGIIPLFFPNLDDQQQGQIFAFAIILFYPTTGVAAVLLMNKYLNKRMGLKEGPSDTAMEKFFELHQKITFLVNEYRVLKPTPRGQMELSGFVRQKRLALREQFQLFRDEDQKEILATTKARTIVDLGATYDIVDASGKPIGSLKKEFTKSLLRSTWKVYGTDPLQVSFTLRERNQLVAIFRRLWDLVTDFGFPVKYQFEILDNTNKLVGEYIKITRFRDHYAFYFYKDRAGSLDDRVWIVTAVLLDAMQSR